MEPFTTNLFARLAVKAGADSLAADVASHALRAAGVPVDTASLAAATLPEVHAEHRSPLAGLAAVGGVGGMLAGAEALRGGALLRDTATQAASLNRLSVNGADVRLGDDGLLPDWVQELLDTDTVEFTWEEPVPYEHVWNVDDFSGVGDPEGAAACWQQQTGNSCAVMAQVGVYEYLSGERMTEADATAFCEAQGWYDPDSGTSPADVGNLLEAEGYACERSYGNDLESLADALERGDQVIVGLDASEIWYTQRDPVTGERIPQGLGYGHAVWITGIDTDAAGNVTVIMNDTGHPDGQMRAVAAEDFLAGWDAYDNFAVIVPADGGAGT